MTFGPGHAHLVVFFATWVDENSNVTRQLRALDAYEQVLHIVMVGHPERSRTRLHTLFQQGLQELQLALDDNLFRQSYLPGVKQEAINAFKNRLASWVIPPLATRDDARKQVKETAKA